MGIFRSLKSTIEKSKAAVVVQNLLEHQMHMGFLDVRPAALANQLVAEAWDARPDIFNGKFGQRPHKITVAACALAQGIDYLEPGSMVRSALGIALGNILAELDTNGRLYPLNSLDHQLLEEATAIFMSLTGEAEESLLEDVTDLDRPG
ncbi:hypothetical protein MSNKSG1_16741 [Marinobacter santoriniensis NKSG1]|uniref:Uncharacterized protein n=1 Tax=Marinobacter santoriniensis NKSG1 TaxID=1288826 RepID=M7CQ94_9GAMM|nr:hypothetical protein [Marinobacter santoriniensis]EMP54245.1 hypothetical protein MSNKSG1_16741 [Marinobacter santoriniensis NKSG1]